ncbi:MAG TPA: hypothetical protein VE008_07415 [Burkholderiales bacterium]|nr:hypothetical protein [Burkholderiales bacterium]
MSENLRLVYTEARSDGIFGWILPAEEPADGNAQPLCVFVTRAYKQPDGKWRPKVRAGIYECQRGKHRLHGMTEDFETFEVLGIKGHSGILLGHWGSWGSDSDGCFCLGRKIVKSDQDRDGIDGPDELVTESRTTFAEYMKNRAGIDNFAVIIEEHFAETAQA